MKLNFIVCANGLGHLSRCVSLALEVKKRTDFRVKIYCSKTGFDALNLESKFRHSEVHIVKDMRYLQEESFDKEYWHNLMSQENGENEIFISDNLISFLEIKPECIVIANFFWHDVDIKIQKQKKTNLNALLRSTQPYVMGHHFFAMPIVNAKTFTHTRIVMKSVVET